MRPNERNMINMDIPLIRKVPLQVVAREPAVLVALAAVKVVLVVD